MPPSDTLYCGHRAVGRPVTLPEHFSMHLLKRLLRAFIVGSLAGIAVTAIFLAYPALLDRIEYITYYFRCQYAVGQPDAVEVQKLREAEPDVCLVDIDDRSLARLGGYWGWNRGYHARMINSLSSHFPAAVAFDIMFDNPEDQRYINRIDEVIERAGRTADIPESTRRRILSSVDYDVRLIEATRASGVVYHAVRLAERKDYPEHAQSRIAFRTTPEWFEALNPQSTIQVPLSLDGASIESRPIIDGLFPSLARASRGVGHVNVPPSDDGVVREIPMLYRFDSTQNAYLPLSVRVCATLFGTPTDEIDFNPGKYLDIGTPFKIIKGDDGSLTTSYPNLRARQVKLILERYRSQASCDSCREQLLMGFAALALDSSGSRVLNTDAGPIGEPLLSALLDANLDSITTLPDGEALTLGPDMALTRDSEGSYTLSAPTGQQEWYFGDDLMFTLKAVADERDSLVAGPLPRLLYYPFKIQRQSGELVSNIPVLRGKALSQLLRMQWARIEAVREGKRIEFGDRVRIPLTADNHHIITYFGPSRDTYRTYSYSAIYDNQVQGGLQGKVYLVGSSASGLFDFKHAPVDRTYPAMQVHASLMRSFLTNTFVHRLPPWGDILIAVLIGILVGVAAFAAVPWAGGIVVAVATVGYALTAIALFDSAHLWIEMARPILTVILSYAAVMSYRYMTEEKDRKFLQSTFKTYLSPDIIDAMYREKQFPKLGGEEAVLTAYFTDIQSFSTFSEKLGSPTRLVELLNEYLSDLTNILIEHGGTLDKYEGDAILAFFGAPMPMEDHALQACLTALAMQTKLGQLRDKWRSEGEKWPQIVHAMQMRIGVNTGPIVTGNMGSTMRMNYTMMGDAVNLAARLESAAKQYGVYTMISEDTYRIVRDKFEVRQLDKIQVVGKSDPVVVYELLSARGGLSPEMSSLVARYNEGLAAFYARDWDTAARIFAETEPLEPNRGVAPRNMSPSKKILDLCGRFKAEPPPQGWTGVTMLTSK